MLTLQSLIKMLDLTLLDWLFYNFHRMVKVYKVKKPLGFPYDTIEDKGGKKDSYSSGFGQLSIKEEAAGKVRVFAIVDV